MQPWIVASAIIGGYQASQEHGLAIVIFLKVLRIVVGRSSAHTLRPFPSSLIFQIEVCRPATAPDPLNYSTLMDPTATSPGGKSLISAVPASSCFDTTTTPASRLGKVALASPWTESLDKIKDRAYGSLPVPQRLKLQYVVLRLHF